MKKVILRGSATGVCRYITYIHARDKKQDANVASEKKPATKAK
jgi:hypothetical protein